MMAHNLDGKEGMNPVLDGFSAGDGTIPGVFSGKNESLMINPAVPVDNSSPAGNETTLHFFGGADEDSSAKGTDELGETENINSIDQDDSSTRDDGTIAVFPAGAINPINQDDSSGRYEGIAGGLNDDEAEHEQNPISHPPSIGNDPSSDKDSSSGTYNHPPMGFVLETRSEPTKKAINRGSSGAGQDDDENHPSSAGRHETPPLETSSGNKKENSSVETKSPRSPKKDPPKEGKPGGTNY